MAFLYHDLVALLKLSLNVLVTMTPKIQNKNTIILNNKSISDLLNSYFSEIKSEFNELKIISYP